MQVLINILTSCKTKSKENNWYIQMFTRLLDLLELFGASLVFVILVLEELIIVRNHMINMLF